MRYNNTWELLASGYGLQNNLYNALIAREIEIAVSKLKFR